MRNFTKTLVFILVSLSWALVIVVLAFGLSLVYSLSLVFLFALVLSLSNRKNPRGIRLTAIYFLVGCTIIIGVNKIYLPPHFHDPFPNCINETNTFISNRGSSAVNFSLEIFQIHKPEDFRYAFKSFLVEDGKDYLLVNVRNEKLCFDAKILIEKWGKLQDMKKTNGASYPKELFNLNWAIQVVDGKKEFLYKDMWNIID